MPLLKTINYTTNTWLTGVHNSFDIVVSVGTSLFGSNLESITTTCPLIPKTVSIFIPLKFANLLEQGNSIIVGCLTATGGGSKKVYLIDDIWSSTTELRIVFSSIDINYEEGGTRIKVTADIELWN